MPEQQKKYTDVFYDSGKETRKIQMRKTSTSTSLSALQLRAKGCVSLVKILEWIETVTNTGKAIPADMVDATTDSLE